MLTFQNAPKTIAGTVIEASGSLYVATMRLMSPDRLYGPCSWVIC